jgi:hypothetical protein
MMEDRRGREWERRGGAARERLVTAGPRAAAAGGGGDFGTDGPGKRRRVGSRRKGRELWGAKATQKEGGDGVDGGCNRWDRGAMETLGGGRPPHGNVREGASGPRAAAAGERKRW